MSVHLGSIRPTHNGRFESNLDDLSAAHSKISFEHPKLIADNTVCKVGDKPKPRYSPSLENRVRTVLAATAAQLPAAVGDELNKLVSPENIGFTLAGMAAMGVLAGTGVGEFISVVGILGGWIACGGRAISAAQHLGTAARLTMSPASKDDLVRAGEELAHAVIDGGIGLVTGLLTHRATLSRMAVLRPGAAVHVDSQADLVNLARAVNRYSSAGPGRQRNCMSCVSAFIESVRRGKLVPAMKNADVLKIAGRDLNADILDKKFGIKWAGGEFPLTYSAGYKGYSPPKILAAIERGELGDLGIIKISTGNRVDKGHVTVFMKVAGKYFAVDPQSGSVNRLTAKFIAENYGKRWQIIDAGKLTR